jgi:hypothetical protein
MKFKEVLAMMPKQAKIEAAKFYRDNEKQAVCQRDWLSGGFESLVTRAVNHGLAVTLTEGRIETLSSNTANAVASRLEKF